MKKAILIILILIISSVIIYCEVKKYDKEDPDQPLYLDLFFANAFFENKITSPWQTVDSSKIRPIDWKYNTEEFYRLDSIVLGIQNLSKEKMYYMTWGSITSRIRNDYIVYKDGIADSVLFGGFGCGSGIYLTPLKRGEIVIEKINNPLMFNLYSNWRLDIKDKDFPHNFKKYRSVAMKDVVNFIRCILSCFS